MISTVYTNKTNFIANNNMDKLLCMLKDNLLTNVKYNDNRSIMVEMNQDVDTNKVSDAVSSCLVNIDDNISKDNITFMFDVMRLQDSCIVRI